jgi:hypothetical protein
MLKLQETRRTELLSDVSRNQVQMVECLLRKLEALSSNTSTAEDKNKNKKPDLER